MFVCHRCNIEARDGVQCTLCLNWYDFPCAGITEAGYRRLGDRKVTWKCSACKTGLASPLNPPTSKPTVGKVAQVDLDNIYQELKKLTDQVSTLPQLVENVRSIQIDISELKTLKDEMPDFKKSLNHVHATVDELTDKLTDVEGQIQSLQKTKEDITRLEQRLEKIETALHENDQRLRLNNVEIKGVPVTSSENLYAIVSKICNKVNCEVRQDQINYIARVPQRNSKENKNIIMSLHNRYLRDDFVAAAKKCKNLKITDIGLNGNGNIYVNDHLTFENKQLLNKAKLLTKEKNFSYIWVKNCKILVKKNTTSPTFVIKSESDLKKIT
ncbi:hypothetical protein B5X24_HaOG210861 [Helicoverpa armigera]|nr:hypothetical protein B5X24_HaOG210861 [Helicoverpa armigera]